MSARRRRSGSRGARRFLPRAPRGRLLSTAGGEAAPDADAAVRHGSLIRVGRGCYAEAERWRGAHSEGRHLMRVVAAERRRTGNSELVYSHASAAVLWELPLFRVEPRRVHLSRRIASGHVRASEPLVARHQVAVASSDVTMRQGVICTGLARTVADVLRSASFETGLSLADAALRRAAWSWNGYDVEAAESLRRQVAQRLPSGGRGVRAARRMLELADGRAASPGESVSRLYIGDLGFATPRLQVPVAGPGSRLFHVDFALDDVGVWGEYDGEGKYLDPAMRGEGVGVERVVMEEKQREDWIRGTTGRRLARWGTAHIATAAHLGARLRAFGIHPQR